MKSSSLLESSSLLHMTRPLAAAAEVSMTPPASMAAEMLMVRKPCNCKLRLSHIKQIAIANQTSGRVRRVRASEQMAIIMAGI